MASNWDFSLSRKAFEPEKESLTGPNLFEPALSSIVVLSDLRFQFGILSNVLEVEKSL